MLHTGRYQSNQNLSSFVQLKSEPVFLGELYPRLLEKELISLVFLGQSPHHLHDSSKQCEFHFGRPGHSLEDCHALKRKVQDLVNHGILRINEGSTLSVIIAWSPEHRKVEVKDGTIIPSLKSQGPTTCNIQPVHLSTLPTLSEARKPTVPKVRPKLTLRSCNLDNLCSSDREKANYPTNKYMTLKRKIKKLGRLEPEVPIAVQPGKSNMHTIHRKRIKSTVDSYSHEPSKDQTD